MLSGVAFTASSVQAAPFGQRHGVTHAGRAAIARSQANLDALKWRARADGHVTLWERARINTVQARHDALVARYRHN
jgi:hypothetical protein